jgi:hypothetical protein
MSKHPTSEFERELTRATIRACGVNPPESQDYDAIVAEAIERTNAGSDWPFTVVIYNDGDREDRSPSFETEPFATLPDAIAAIGVAIHKGSETWEALLFHGQPLDLSEYQAAQDAAIAAEKERAATAARLERERMQALYQAENERRERAQLAALKAKYEKPA